MSLGASGDAEGALAEYRKAHDLKPHDWSKCFILTEELRRQGQHEAANRVMEPYIAKCREASIENPDDSTKHAVLGKALRFNGDLEGAISEYRWALRLSPHSPFLHDCLRDLLVKKGKLPEAIAESREIVRIRRDAWAYCELGKVLLQKGDVDAAIPEFGTAIRLEPNNATAHYNLGLALYDKGDVDGAIAEYREVLRLEPDSENAHVNLGLALRHKGDLDDAIAEYREALRLNPNNDGVHFLLGIVLELNGDRRDALEEYRAAYMHDPKNADYKDNYERLMQQVNS
jgi:Flp pilus assembly protein TadD